jgi:CheY-like chemotaxis protein
MTREQKQEGINILHADDEPDFLAVTKVCLKRENENFDIDTTTSAEEGIELLKGGKYDIVVSDYMMSGMDGLEFLGNLRQSGSTIPFVIFTGKGREEVAMEALNRGASCYLQKGGDVKSLYGTLARVIKGEVEKKRAEKWIKHRNSVLRAIRSVNQLITSENDRDRLFKGVCDNLIETYGYHIAWMAILDESGGLVTAAEAGLGKEFLPMVERLKRGELPDCGWKALMQSDVVVIEDPLSTCAGCPFADTDGGRGALTARLEYGEKVYGLLSVSIPADITAEEEEQTLFKEVAGDIAFALHSMELEEERAHLLKELESFTHAVSHDLRTPLFTIQGFVSILRKDLEQGKGEKVESDLKQIENGVTMMDRLLNDALELSRIDRVSNPRCHSGKLFKKQWSKQQRR